MSFFPSLLTIVRESRSKKDLIKKIDRELELHGSAGTFTRAPRLSKASASSSASPTEADTAEDAHSESERTGEDHTGDTEQSLSAPIISHEQYAPILKGLKYFLSNKSGIYKKFVKTILSKFLNREILKQILGTLFQLGQCYDKHQSDKDRTTSSLGRSAPPAFSSPDSASPTSSAPTPMVMLSPGAAVASRGLHFAGAAYREGEVAFGSGARSLRTPFRKGAAMSAERDYYTQEAVLMHRVINLLNTAASDILILQVEAIKDANNTLASIVKKLLGEEVPPEVSSQLKDMNEYSMDKVSVVNKFVSEKREKDEIAELRAEIRNVIRFIRVTARVAISPELTKRSDEYLKLEFLCDAGSTLASSSKASEEEKDNLRKNIRDAIKRRNSEDIRLNAFFGATDASRGFLGIRELQYLDIGKDFSIHVAMLEYIKEFSKVMRSNLQAMRALLSGLLKREHTTADYASGGAAAAIGLCGLIVPGAQIAAAIFGGACRAINSTYLKKYWRKVTKELDSAPKVEILINAALVCLARVYFVHGFNINLGLKSKFTQGFEAFKGIFDGRTLTLAQALANIDAARVLSLLANLKKGLVLLKAEVPDTEGGHTKVVVVSDEIVECVLGFCEIKDLFEETSREVDSVESEEIVDVKQLADAIFKDNGKQSTHSVGSGSGASTILPARSFASSPGLGGGAAGGGAGGGGADGGGADGGGAGGGGAGGGGAGGSEGSGRKYADDLHIMARGLVPEDVGDDRSGATFPPLPPHPKDQVIRRGTPAAAPVSAAAPAPAPPPVSAAAPAPAPPPAQVLRQAGSAHIHTDKSHKRKANASCCEIM